MPALSTWTKALLPIGSNNIWIFNEYQNRLDEPIYVPIYLQIKINQEGGNFQYRICLKSV